MGYRMSGSEHIAASAPKYQEDCKRIVGVAFNAGFIITVREAESIWDDYSEMLAAGWLGLPDDDNELWQIIQSGVEKRCP